MDVKTLLMAAQGNRECANIATDVFRRKHAHKTIKFSIGDYDDDNLADYFIIERTQSIEIRNYKLSGTFLEIFGPFIRSIKTMNNYNGQKYFKHIATLISQHCNELTSIILYNCNEESYELEQFPSPLKSVTNVEINKFLVASDHRFKLDRVFPNVQSMRWTSLKEIDPSILNVELPQLEIFKVKHPFCSDLNEALELLFKKNSQIRSLTLYFYNAPNYLTLASKFLPNLEHLKINLQSSASHLPNEIHLPKVTKLKVIAHNLLNYFEVLKFENLEEISLFCNSNECFGFLANNGNVKKLEIIGDVGGEHVIRFGKTLKHLTEFSLKNGEEINATAFIQLINESEHLNKLRLNVPGLGNGLFDDLKNHLEGEWSISTDGEIIFLEKLHSVYLKSKL